MACTEGPRGAARLAGPSTGWQYPCLSQIPLAFANGAAYLLDSPRSFSIEEDMSEG